MMRSTATFSDDRLYRWDLTRIQTQGPVRAWILLNPSTADEHTNDPTVFRCMQRDIGEGFAGTIVLNIFALRSTDPQALYTAKDPIGLLNDSVIRYWACHPAVKQIACGWGNHGLHLERGQRVLEILLRCKAARKMRAIALTKFDQPVHPLYQAYANVPKRWKELVDGR